MPTVIHEKSGPDGIRLTLDEPLGINQAHADVVARVPGLTRDHDLLDREGHAIYRAGEPCEDVTISLAGQREFLVPTGTAAVAFEDGTTHTIGGQA